MVITVSVWQLYEVRAVQKYQNKLFFNAFCTQDFNFLEKNVFSFEKFRQKQYLSC